MPLASWYSLHFHGPASMSAVAYSMPTAEAVLKGLAFLSADSQSTPTASARLISGRPLTAMDLTTPTASATMRGRARMSAVGRVNALTQDDVASAVLESQIESGVTLKQVLRLLSSVAAGKTSIDTAGPNPVVSFRNIVDTKDRVVATMSGSERSIVNTDLT